MKKVLTLLLLLLPGVCLLAQKATVSGKVTDSETGEPLSRASVVQEGTANGVFTGADGAFSLSLPAGNHTLIISYLGFRTESKPLSLSAGQKATLDVALVTTSLQGEEVVISASRRAKK